MGKGERTGRLHTLDGSYGGFPACCAQKQGHLFSCLQNTEGVQRPVSFGAMLKEDKFWLDNHAEALFPVQEKRGHYKGSDPENLQSPVGHLH